MAVKNGVRANPFQGMDPAIRTQLLSLLIGLLAFVAFSGPSALSPTRLDWVMVNFDTPTMHLGWQFFRGAPWLQWPLGLNPDYGFDAPASIVLSDSIPLLALLFKPFSAWLPADFQYLGLWALACFLLQAWLACKLLQRFSQSAAFCLLGCAFFATATIFLNRLYFHPALAGQWLVLAAFCLYLAPAFRFRSWLGLMVLASTIHAYLVVMVGVVWAADLIQRRLRREAGLGVLGANLVLVLGTSLLMMWALGYFLPINVLGTAARTSANLLFPFWNGLNAYGYAWSALVPGFDINPWGGDGFGYFGVGFMLLAAVALVPWPPRPGEAMPVRPWAWIILSLACTSLLVFALGNQVYAGERLLWSYQLPSWLDRIYGVFRGAGRLIWPFWYLVLVAVLYRIATRLPRRAAIAVLGVALLLQGIDLSRPARETRYNFSVRPEWKDQLASPAWGELARHYRRVVFLMPGAQAQPFMMSVTPQYQQVASFAARHGMAVNLSYLARVDDIKVEKYRQLRVQMLSQARFEADTVYVVTDPALLLRAGCTHPERSWTGRIDGMDMLVPGGQALPLLGALPERACPR